MKVHLKTCRLKDDEIRLLELERDIEPDLPECSKECRFCNKLYSTKGNLNRHITVCKERKEYKKIILKHPISNSIINNNTNCHNTTTTTTNSHNNNNNTFNINFYGQATDTHILKKQLEAMIKRCIKCEGDYEGASELTTDYCNSMYSIEENNNIDIKDQRSTYGKVITPKGNKYILVTKIMDTVLKSTAEKLQSRLDELEEAAGGFKKEITLKIHEEVRRMREDGFKHYYDKKERNEFYNNLLLIFTERDSDDEESDSEDY
jgi:hypothetical protein